jgi:hypothetical protein
MTSDVSFPCAGMAAIVIVRNWLRDLIFSICMPYSVDATCLSNTFCLLWSP